MAGLVSRLLLPLTAVVLMTGVPLQAGAQIPQAEYEARRDSLATLIDDGVLLAFGATSPTADAVPFRQLPGFRYLTGYLRPDAALLMVVRDGEPRQTMLFEPAIDPNMALFEGFAPDSAELEREIGLGLRPLDALRPALDTLVDELPLYVLTDVHARDYVRRDSLTRGRRFVELLAQANPNVEIRSADRLVDQLRLSKSRAELAHLRDAIDITVVALERAMRAIEPGLTERQIQAVLEYTFLGLGGEGPSFTPIVASGPNATSYHHRASERVMRAGEVVVMDVGAAVGGYAADVTRTVPVDGTFSEEEAAIYSIVLDAQEASVRTLRAGAPIGSATRAAREVLAEGLARLGLIQSADAVLDPPWAPVGACRADGAPLQCSQAFLYMAHGLGHGIGLEVHDVGGHAYALSGRLQAGEVLTIEPGIYVSTTLLDMLPDTPRNREFIAGVRDAVERYENIGVRIEDDYLITDDGAEWLSPAPRTIEEVEATVAEPLDLPEPEALSR